LRYSFANLSRMIAGETAEDVRKENVHGTKLQRERPGFATVALRITVLSIATVESKKFESIYGKLNTK